MNMKEHSADSLQLAELDSMIARAEAICERYRQSAEEEGLSQSCATKRRAALQTVRGLLARLRIQRAAAERLARAASG